MNDTIEVRLGLIDVHLTHLRAAGYSPRTIYDRERLLLAADLALPYGLDQATTEELAVFLSQPGWAAWTRCTYHRHICGFYRWATSGKTRYLADNPAADLTNPRNPVGDPHPVTDDEMRHAMERSDPWWQRAIALAAFAGLRASEISHLRREHVTADAITIWHGKGNKTKRIPTHPEVWRRVEPLPPGWLFTCASGEPYRGLPGVARQHFNRIGLPHVHLHMFRHWYATTLLSNGADIVTVQHLMRHASLQTTAGYLALVDGRRRDAIDLLRVPVGGVR